ncbi:hypothetical protein [Bradyrhizobium lablabi]|uniref:hypothetical protein n=1 Tax=Bradyrhizobium lablabi TaxID=722472 RepID=UPI001BAA7495|nr:hypothetical protein [Bradyrhizobium lablabi]MBR0698117.1 hypothetical protein [Bradyrhizobium lablabi]
MEGPVLVNAMMAVVLAAVMLVGGQFFIRHLPERGAPTWAALNSAKMAISEIGYVERSGMRGVRD